MAKIIHNKKAEDFCPYCKIGELILRHGRYSDFLGCSRYPNCAGIVKIKKEENETDKITDDWLKEHDK